MEPISISECANVRPHDKGQLPICNTGWGYFPLNLLKASLSIFHNLVDRISVLRIMEPREGTRVDIINGHTMNRINVTKNVLNISWTMIGTGTDGPYNLYINNTIVKTEVVNASTILLNLDPLIAKKIIAASGAYELKIVAIAGFTRFNFSKINVDNMMSEPRKTVTASRIIEVSVH